MTRHCQARLPTDSRSFIVKLWQDGDASRSQGSGWRGQITSVPSGERFYVRKAADLPTLLAWQIGRSGIRLGWYWCLKVAFHVWRQRWMKESRR